MSFEFCLIYDSLTLPLGFLALDSKSDFVVYKLKQMGKIVEKDISEVCRQFNRLDVDNMGKITLSCLIKLHEASVSHKGAKL
jgi:potassium channel subfamily K